MAATGALVCLQSLEDARNGEDRANAGDGIAGREQHDCGRHDGIDHARSGFGLIRSGETNRIDRILIPALHEIFLEAQLADGRVDPGFHAGIAHGENARLHAHPGGDVGGHFGQSFALPKQFCAQQVDGEVAVAGVKPDGLAQFAHGLQAKESVALHAPAALLAEQSGQHVGDGIEIGRNVKSPPLQIVSGVDDDGEILGGND